MVRIQRGFLLSAKFLVRYIIENHRESQHDSANASAEGAMTVNKQLTMVYWKGERFWLGKLLEHPEIMTQGETLEELEDNLKDAYRLPVMDDVPDDHHTKAFTL
jgi:predicted RNase H-like HicB family nuclease